MFKPKDEQQVAVIDAKVGESGLYELFTTASHFDETANNAECLADDSARTK